MTSVSEHHRKLERMYLESAPINDFFDPEMTIEDGRATIEHTVTEKFFHAAGAAHGVTYFKALDDAAFFATNSLVEDVFVLTTQINFHLTRPVSEGTIRAVGEVVHEHPSQYLAQAVLEDDSGNHLARATGTFVRSDIELTPEIGYE